MKEIPISLYIELETIIRTHIEEISQKDKARYEANKDSVLKRMSEK